MRSVLPVHRLRLLAANSLAVLSFIVFAVSVLSLHQEGSIPFTIEQNGPFPVVLSRLLFGSPRGLVDSGLSDFFWRKVPGVPAEEAVERAVNGMAPQWNDLAPAPDGNGIGAIVMVRAAFALFGAHAHALPYFFVLVLGVSTAAFMFRYQDKRIFAVPVLFTAFTALILTPMTAAGVVDQVPFGGVRSYAIVGILAALHWCFEMTVDRTVFRPGTRIRFALLGVQIGVLGLAILVRGSPAYLLGPVIVVAIYHVRRNWGDPGLRAMLMRLAVPVAALIAIPSGIAPLAFPDYVRAGKASTVVWHRIFISFGAHPAWPFAGMRETYSCPGIPESLVAAIVDRNGHCVWLAYAHDHALPSGQIGQGLYGGAYEAAMRSAVWHVVRTYPKEALETLFYYKPETIIDTMVAMLRLQGSAVPRLISVLLMLQVAILAIFIAAWPVRAALIEAGRGAGFSSMFLLFGLLPQLAAWTVVNTAIDVFVYVLCVGIMGFWLVFAAAAVVCFVPPRGRSYEL